MSLIQRLNNFYKRNKFAVLLMSFLEAPLPLNLIHDPILTKDPYKIQEEMKRRGKVLIVEYHQEYWGNVYEIINDINCDGKIDLFMKKMEYREEDIRKHNLEKIYTHIIYRRSLGENYDTGHRKIGNSPWKLVWSTTPSYWEPILQGIDNNLLNSNKPEEDYKNYLEQLRKIKVDKMKVTKRDFCIPNT